MIKKVIFPLSILLSLSILSCKKNIDNNVDMSLSPIVSVKGKTLYKMELETALGRKTSAEDSIAIADSYIKTWIEDQLIYDKAEDNLRDMQTIDQLVKDYRKELITQSYQDQIIKQEISNRKISEEDVLNYYNDNKSHLKLNEHIIKGLFLKIPLSSPQVNNFRKWYKQINDASINEIEKNALQHAVGYEHFYNKWVSLDDILDRTPVILVDEAAFLKGNKTIEQQDSSFLYLINIKEYKLSGEIAPYEYMQDKLYDILLKKEQMKFIKQIKEDLYEKAISDDEVKFYNKK